MIVHSNAFVYSTCLLGIDSRYGEILLIIELLLVRLAHSHLLSIASCIYRKLHLIMLKRSLYITFVKVFPEPLLLIKGFVPFTLFTSIYFTSSKLSFD